MPALSGDQHVGEVTASLTCKVPDRVCKVPNQDCKVPDRAVRYMISSRSASSDIAEFTTNLVKVGYDKIVSTRFTFAQFKVEIS